MNIEKEIIKDLYKFALKDKSEAEITLAEIEYPETIKAKLEMLEKLKKNKIIKSYKFLEPKNVVFDTSKCRKPAPLEIEQNPDILLKKTPDYYDEISLCNIKVRFEPKKIIKYYEEINRKEIVENAFKNETVIQCGDLRFGLESGYAIYKETIANFKPDSKEYNLLKELIAHKNRRRNTEQLSKIIYNKDTYLSKNNLRRIKFFINSIRKKLNMYGKNAENEDLFEASNGYRIRCK